MHSPTHKWLSSLVIVLFLKFVFSFIFQQNMFGPQSPIYVNIHFWCVWTGNMYRRGARRWRKLYVYNGHSYQAKRFSRVRIFWLSVFIVVLSLMSFWSVRKYVERFYLKSIEYYCVSKQHLGCMNVLVFGHICEILHVRDVDQLKLTMCMDILHPNVCFCDCK